MPKLKVLRCLGNPRPRKKKKAPRAKIVRRNPPKEQQYGLRAITGDWKTGKDWRPVWWYGAKWGPAESKAKRFTKAGARAALASVPKPAGWFVIDGIAL